MRAAVADSARAIENPEFPARYGGTPRQGDLFQDVSIDSGALAPPGVASEIAGGSIGLRGHALGATNTLSRYIAVYAPGV